MFSRFQRVITLSLIAVKNEVVIILTVIWSNLVVNSFSRKNVILSEQLNEK